MRQQSRRKIFNSLTTMLEYLRIQNLALIQDEELEFASGLNVLTGETGAGKSFILKAVRFLTGDRLDRDIVRPGQEKATVEALFALPEGDMILRRELSAETGRGRIFINDSLVSQDTVRELKSRLFLHASQFSQQRFLQPARQAALVDDFLKNPALPTQKEQRLKTLREIAATRTEMTERSRNLEAQREFLEFQRAEIEKTNPRPGEEEELELRRGELRGTDHLRERVDAVLELLHRSPDGPGLLEGLAHLGRELGDVARTFPEYDRDASAVEEFRLGLLDTEAGLRRLEAAPTDGMNLEAVEARLFQLAALKRKLKRSLDSIEELRQEINENLSFLDACGLDLKRLDKEEAEQAKELASVLEQLNAARRVAGAELTDALGRELQGLGFSEGARLDVEFSPSEVYPGLREDRPRLLWAPNPGQLPQPLEKIVSGGELSRFLLAVVGLLAESEDLPTLFFDEVDAGVGGVTLGRLGERLRAIAAKRQVILVTHWPQLAALAVKSGKHFQVRKEVKNNETSTYCAPLKGAEIEEELARMGGGGPQGQALARSLLED